MRYLSSSAHLLQFLHLETLQLGVCYSRASEGVRQLDDTLLLDDAAESRLSQEHIGNLNCIVHVCRALLEMAQSSPLNDSQEGPAWEGVLQPRLAPHAKL